MTKLYKNIFRMAGKYLPAVLAVFVLASCSDDEEVFTPCATLDSPVLAISDVGSNSIEITWTAVDGARQYCYRAINSKGKVANGGMTQERSVTIKKLQPLTSYTIELTAYPTIIGSANISQATIGAQTVFYARVDSVEGNYTSSLLNADGDTWTATLDEDRSAENYVEDTFGVFTLYSFFNNERGKLVFRVNENNTITILNATKYDDDGWAVVNTGWKLSNKTIYINESSSVFDRESKKLTYTAKLGNSATPQTEEFTW